MCIRGEIRRHQALNSINNNIRTYNTSFRGHQGSQQKHVAKNGESKEVSFGEGFTQRLIEMFFPKVKEKKASITQDLSIGVKAVTHVVGKHTDEAIVATNPSAKVVIPPVPAFKPVTAPVQPTLNVVV